MKKYLPIFILSLSLFLSCSSVSAGDEFVLTDDIAVGKNSYYAELLHESIRKHKPEDGTRLFYLGHAIRIEKGEKIKVTYIIGDCIFISYNDHEYCVNKKYLSKYSKKL